MSLMDIFSLETDTIDIAGLDTLINFSRYQPHLQDNFLTGLLLDKDLISHEGVTLYTQGTTLTPDRIARLIQIHEMHPAFDFEFKIKRGPELIAKFKQDIITKLAKLLAFRSKYKVYSNFFGNKKEEILSYFDNFLASDARILTVYKMKFITNASPMKNSALFFNHSLSLAMFAYALAPTKDINEVTPFSQEEIDELVSAALFHGFGAIHQSDAILKEKPDDRKEVYNDVIRSSPELVKELNPTSRTLEAMKFAGDYNFDAVDFIKEDKDKTCMMANIITVADIFLQTESGLFGVREKISHIIDALNLRALRSKVNPTVVKALTLALQFNDIFDFYQEMENLKNLCRFDGGKHGLPYPMNGFKSPTLFVCKDQKNDCEHFEKSLKAVNVVTNLEDLPIGKYARCTIATHKLLEFYRGHYGEIKEDFKKSGKDQPAKPE